ncbi:MAG: hypothetical protein HY326_12340 [Chloroflexi bacterium]|nr:hypothetical protein [Chloroflexota bacterium]
MAKQPMVVFFGKSLFVAGVEASLRNRPGLNMTRVDVPIPDAENSLTTLHPDVIIFDNSDDKLATLLGMTRLFKENPGVLVIGLDLNGNEVMVVTRQQRLAMNVEDVVEAIRQGVGRV